MKKPHLIAASLLALAAIAAAQATTAAQSFIRVLEVAGEVQVAARDASIRDSVTWVTTLTLPQQNAIVTDSWVVPQGFKARVTGGFDPQGNNPQSNWSVETGGASFGSNSLGSVISGGVVLSEGDSLTLRFSGGNFSYPYTNSFFVTLELVEL